jgi:hypothetical protein
MELWYRGDGGLWLRAGHDGVEVGLPDTAQAPVEVVVDGGRPATLRAGQSLRFGRA